MLELWWTLLFSQNIVSENTGELCEECNKEYVNSLYSQV